MSLIEGYSSSDSDSEPVLLKQQVQIAPDVELPLEKVPNEPENKETKTLTGYIQHEMPDEDHFKTLKRTFEVLGYTTDANGEIVGNLELALKFGAVDMDHYKPSKAEIQNIKRQRSDRGEAGILTGKKAYKGPWAKYESSSESDFDLESEPGTEDEDEVTVPKKQNIVYETTEFFGSLELDYQGRTYMHVPRDLDVDLTKEVGSQECFVPKKQIHKWDGHVGGTNKLQFFPNSGHLLLSCGNDNKIYIYDAYHKRELLRGYFGHTKAVRDINFNVQGDKFLSCSYDHYIKQWDTETGKCISKVKVSAIPNVVKFNPNPAYQNEFLCGLSDKKIEQFDLRTNEVVQTYDHHLGAINSLTFIDDNKKFVSSSDDKSLRIWNYQINIPIKIISDPKQHSMPSVVLHPSQKYILCQSMNNTIEVIGAQGNKYKRNKKKLFRGHNCAGYGIGINFSPDGKILMSGDNSGYGFFWDWKSGALVTKLKVDTKLISCIEPNPQEVSKVAMSGLSGSIYYYE